MQGQPTEIMSLCRQNGHCVLTKTPIPEISAKEVLIEVSIAAICLTDIYAATGVIDCKDGVVLGHEFVGHVVAKGDAVVNGEIQIGSRVAVMPYVPCGDCSDCNQGLSWQCSQSKMLGININGGFSQFVALPASQVYLINNALPDTLNSFAEPVAAAMSVLQAPIEREQKIWVCGEGRIANLCAFILRQHGYKKLFQGSSAPSESYDALVLVGQPKEALDENTAVVWLQNLKADGLIVLKTRSPDPLLIPINLLIKKRLRIHAVNYAPIDQALAFIEQHADFFTQLSGLTFPLEQHQQAFTEATINNQHKIFLQIKAK